MSVALSRRIGSKRNIGKQCAATKVGDFDQTICQKEVAWLDVTMNDSSRVQKLEPSDNVQRIFSN
jgi:hypothetical protein